jgi:hypothetical protein
MTPALTAKEATQMTISNVERIASSRTENSAYNLQLLLDKLIKAAAKEGYGSLVMPRDVLLESDKRKLFNLGYDFTYNCPNTIALCWSPVHGKKYWKIPDVENFYFKRLVS